jgi:phospholipid/cholesterol/gamma-HCH transport system ATP-binding protein
MSEVVIQFDGVHKAFGDNVIYEGLNLSIQRGEVLTILGASGSGKSVMLKMILGLMNWDQGRIRVFGEDITGRRDAEMLPVRRRIGMVFQNAALFDSLTVFENLAYPLRERGIADEATVVARVTKALSMVDLPGTEDMLPADLSGGMRKRVGLARAIAVQPEVLLYDEPTTGLDPITTDYVDEMILAAKKRLGVTSVVISHDIASAFKVADQIAFLSKGVIVEQGPPEQLRHSEQPAVKVFLQTWFGKN